MCEYSGCICGSEVSHDHRASNLLRGSTTPCPSFVEMDKRSVRFAKATSPSLLIFDVPDLISAGGESVATFALPLISRQGGLLVALPVGVLEDEAFARSSDGGTYECF